MTNLNSVQLQIRAQWDDMIGRGVMPLLELQTAADEWLIVDIQLTDDNDAITFSFCKEDDHTTSFSGEVETVHSNCYQLLIDECFSSLDSYLEQISGEMLEGYLMPNNLHYHKD